ncbi:hypothetical protein BT96DRAFT_875512 [Gymnopus androsaceus JB14]|uniref:BRCT domain-containing protein n=1 Tax=Gymnopus androsaceus JB14 TaxID=1447944 RepID=A0A6A4ICR5_9AGAR|nr:hypothetical protein BT96DRAFT_875512 [Gymnopus androsaceus JB14]
MAIFRNLFFFIDLPCEFFQNISIKIEENGGKSTWRAENATHIVTFDWDSYKDISGTTPVVTPKWIERSFILNYLQPTQFYSTNPRLIFSGVVGCSADSDNEFPIISSAIQSLGGQWRENIGQDVTHFFANDSDSEKFEKAIAFCEQISAQGQLPSIIIPEWFDEVLKRGELLSIDVYCWPDPVILQDHSQNALLALTPEVPNQTGFMNSRLLMSVVLDLDERRSSIHALIERLDGRVVSIEGNEDEQAEAVKVEDCDIFITAYRDGLAYAEAVRLRKTIASLSWFFHVAASGEMTSPYMQLLHFPVPRTKIRALIQKEVTVTNFTGEARDYVKALIQTMGAVFTPDLRPESTLLLIAASSHTLKYQNALSLKIPIRDLPWLERSFIKWKMVDSGPWTPSLTVSPLLSQNGLLNDFVDSLDLGLASALSPSPVKNHEPAMSVHGDVAKQLPEEHTDKAEPATIQSPQATVGSFLDEIDMTGKEMVERVEIEEVDQEFTRADVGQASVTISQRNSGDRHVTVSTFIDSDSSRRRVDATPASVQAVETAFVSSSKQRIDESHPESVSKKKRKMASDEARPDKKIKSRPRLVKVATTQVLLTEDQRKKLAGLKVKFTTKPTDTGITHLIAEKISLTTKFLCALAVAPFIVTIKWVEDSAAANKLLEEEPYILKDRGEWNEVDLAVSLQRASELKRAPLFKKHTFYITPNVKPLGDERNEFEMILKAFGGDCKEISSPPNDRQLALKVGDDVPFGHYVSCEEDKERWDAVDPKFPIHDLKFIWLSILTQKIEWQDSGLMLREPVARAA